MDFAIKDTTRELVVKVREFIREEIHPLETEFMKNGSFTNILPQLQQKRQMIKDMGLWAPHLPKDYGGMELNLLDFATISEELGRSFLGHFVCNCQAPDIGNMEILLKHGTKEQKEKYFLPLAKGEIRSCFSMTEPDFPGSNPTWMGTTANKKDAVYEINGHKWFTSSASGARFAIVMAITNPEANIHKRASQIIVPTDTAGFELVRNIPIMGDEGDDYFSHAEIQYKNCQVPVENLLGQEGEGFSIAQERLGPGRIHHCMRWIGICERAFELMCKYALKREIAPGNPLANQQIIQHWIAESRAQINAARLMVLQAAWKIDKEGTYKAREEISLIKFLVPQVMRKVLDHAIQVHGALGMTDYTPLSWFYRLERASRIYDGPDEVHKTTVAKKILKRYKTEI